MVKLKNLFQALLLVLLFVLPGCRRIEYRTVQPENPQMKYLLFPVESYQNTLNRAILVSGEELYSGEKIAYYVGNNEVLCDKSNFSLWPDAQQDELVKLLNDELVKWGKETDYRRIEYSQKNNHILLTIIFKSGRKVSYRYKIATMHTVSSAEIGITSAF